MSALRQELFYGLVLRILTRPFVDHHHPNSLATVDGERSETQLELRNLHSFSFSQHDDGWLFLVSMSPTLDFSLPS